VKIALVVPGGVDASGTERVIPAFVWLIERLARRHELHVFSLHQEPEPGEWELCGAPVHNIGRVGARRRRFMARFAAEHRVAPFQLVHALFGEAGTLSLVAGWRHRLPVLLHLAGGEPVGMHDIGYGSLLTLRGRVSLRLALAGARCVTVATPYMQRVVADLGVVTELVPLGVALERWPARAPRHREVGRRARLLHIGDLRPVKDQAMLLAAAVQLRDMGVDFELHVAGADTLGGEIQRSAAARSLGALVQWHGLLARPALRALVEESDLLLMTSRHEAGPLAVLEAAVAGVPTVGTAVGHVDELAPNGAVAVPVGDAAAMARAIAELLADEPRRMALAREAQRHATAHDAEATVARFEQLYGELTT
jgi:glycosyltransferase involved in cell wall biosynthesis